MTFPTVLLRWATLLVCMAPLACAAGGRGSPFGGESDGPLVVEVQNRNFLDATVHLTRDGTRMRLGIVNGKSDQSFTVDWSPNLQMVLYVDFLAGGACRTRPILMQPGQRYVLELRADIRANVDCVPVG
jgi:hypothetical protein